MAEETIKTEARGSHTRFTGAFFTHAQIGMAVLTLDDREDPGSLRVVEVNEAARRIAAIPDDIIGKRADEIPQAAYLPELEHVARAIRENRTIDLGEIPGVFDSSRTFVTKVFPIPPDSCGLIFEDVTSRRRDERQLARARELARMGSWSWDIQQDRVTWSDEMYGIYGLSPKTFPGTVAGFLERVHPDDRALVETSVKDAIASSRPFHHRERITRPDGEVRVLDSQGDCITDGTGKPVQLVGLCRDVTDDERAIRALQESEQRFRKIFEASPAAICVFDLEDGTLKDANPRFVELLGYGSAASLINRHLDMLGMWEGPTEYRELVERLRADRSIRETSVTYRTYGGQVRRALVALELIVIHGHENGLGLFWRA